MFKFEETVYEVPEMTHVVSIWVEYNHNEVQLPDNDSILITLNAVIETSSNATEGNAALIR